MLLPTAGIKAIKVVAARELCQSEAIDTSGTVKGERDFPEALSLTCRSFAVPCQRMLNQFKLDQPAAKTQKAKVKPFVLECDAVMEILL